MIKAKDAKAISRSAVLDQQILDQINFGYYQQFVLQLFQLGQFLTTIIRKQKFWNCR